MKPRQTIHHAARYCLPASLLLLIGLPKPAKLDAQAKDAPVGGLRIALIAAPASPSPSKVLTFRVALSNSGRNDLVLNLGAIFANGKVEAPGAIVVTLTDAQGQSRPLAVGRVHGRQSGILEGRVDPFMLPLPIDATFSVPVDVDVSKLKPGSYSLQAQFTGMGVNPSQQQAGFDMNYWEGRVTSNELRFVAPEQ